VLQFELDSGLEKLGICVEPSLPPPDTRALIASLRALAGNMRAELRPMPASSPTQSVETRPGDTMRFLFRDEQTGESVTFEIVPHQNGQPSFRTVGGLDLRYSRGVLTARSTQFARVLLTAMAGLKSPQSAARWGAVVTRLVERARLRDTTFELKNV
jgi:hypothetical protein